MRISVFVFILALVIAGTSFAEPKSLDRTYSVPADQDRGIEAFQTWLNGFPKRPTDASQISVVSRKTASVTDGVVDETVVLLLQDASIIGTTRFQVTIRVTITDNNLVVRAEYVPGSKYGFYSDKDIEHRMTEVANSLPSELTGGAK